MPPAVAAAAVTAAGALGGAALANRGASRAAQAQQRAGAEALAFERERDAADRAERQNALRLQEQQHNAREAARRSVLRHYGIFTPDVPTSFGGQPSGAPGPAPRGAAPAPMMAAGGETPLVPDAEEDEPVNLNDWNRWRT